MLHYETLLGSLYNTPPCWSIYVCGLVFQHLLDLGGLEAVERNNQAKAKARCNDLWPQTGPQTLPSPPCAKCAAVLSL